MSYENEIHRMIRQGGQSSGELKRKFKKLRENWQDSAAEILIILLSFKIKFFKFILQMFLTQY